MPENDPPSVLAEAHALIYGERQASYGDPRTTLDRTARLWSVVLGMTVTAEQVCMCLVQLKVSRHVNKPKRDNLVDIAGYVGLLDRLGAA